MGPRPVPRLAGNVPASWLSGSTLRSARGGRGAQQRILWSACNERRRETRATTQASPHTGTLARRPFWADLRPPTAACALPPPPPPRCVVRRRGPWGRRGHAQGRHVAAAVAGDTVEGAVVHARAAAAGCGRRPPRCHIPVPARRRVQVAQRGARGGGTVRRAAEGGCPAPRGDDRSKRHAQQGHPARPRAGPPGRAGPRRLPRRLGGRWVPCFAAPRGAGACACVQACRVGVGNLAPRQRHDLSNVRRTAGRPR